MKIDIIQNSFSRNLVGNSKVHDTSKSYGDEVIELLNTVWPVIRKNQIKTTGINYVVYGPNEELFAGVEADMENITQLNLVSKKIRLEKYAYFKHIGPYSTLPEAYANVLSKLKTMNQKVVSPCVEIYGHWTDDEAKLETEIIYALE